MEIYNTNKLIIKTFYNLITKYEKKKNELKNDPSEKKKIQFKISSFKKGLEQIKKYKFMILSTDDIKNLPGVGKGILERVSEILDTGKLIELNENLNIEKYESDNIIFLDDLQRITGVGPVKAKNLLENGIKLIDLLNALKKNNDNINSIPDNSILSLLNHHQLVGLKYLEDIEKRIPRKEIELFLEIFKSIFNEIDKDIKFEICGSFRRKEETSGDIDILLTHPEFTDLSIINRKKLLPSLISILIKKNIIVDNLTFEGNTKYMGICKLSSTNLARRIDIRCVPFSSYIPSILYFTGSKKHNVEIRKLFLKKNMKLSEYNLIEIGTNKEIKLETEEDIYSILSIDYVLPENR